MFRVQVWDDEANRYFDVVLSFDQWGAVGFRHAQPGDTPAEYDDPGEAWRDAVDLQERIRRRDRYTARHVDGRATL